MTLKHFTRLNNPIQFFPLGSGDAQTLCITDDDNVWSWGDGEDLLFSIFLFKMLNLKFNTVPKAALNVLLWNQSKIDNINQMITKPMKLTC